MVAVLGSKIRRVCSDKDVIEITRTVINGDEIIDNINLAVQMLIEQGKWNYVTQD